MPRPKGSKKTPNSGRKKGTPNLRNFEFRKSVLEKLIELKCDPIEGLARIAKNRKVKSNVRARCYSDLAGFIYPKLLRTEVSGVDGNAIKVEHSGAGLERLTGLLDRLAAQSAAGRAAEPTDGSGN